MAQDLWNQNQDETYANEPGNMDQRRGFFGNGGAATPFEQMAAGLKEKGIHLIPIIDAGVKKEEGYRVYEEGKQKRYFCNCYEPSLL